MKRFLFFVIVQGLTCQLWGQFQDDFSTPDLAGFWQGNLDRFAVTDGELQLNHTMPMMNNQTQLYALAPTSTAEETTWSFYIRYEFSPSTSNFARVYLQASQPLSQIDNQQGYYLKIGGISGSDDAIELYRQDGSSSTLLISGTAGAVATQPVEARVLVSRSPAGEWLLEADYTGGEDFDSQGTATDNTYPSGLYLGIACTYTSSRATSFFFDDILADPLLVDEEGPQVTDAVPQSSTLLQVRFNEPLAASAAETSANYTLSPNLGQPQNAELDPGDPTAVLLSLANSMVNFTDYSLEVNNMSDLSGNNSGPQSVNFTFLLPEPALPGDLLITEIMPDPNPPVGLPVEEYIEIYNASDKVIQLADYGLRTSSSPNPVNEGLLLPGSYAILCDTDHEAAFAPFGQVVTLNSFPALTNGGSELELTSAEGISLVQLTYSDDWYLDPLKADGGYSLELIDLTLDNACSGNWRASNAAIGGTPGQENSLLGEAVDAVAPTLLSAFAPSPTEIVVRFDDLLAVEVEDPELFSLSPGVAVGDVLLENDGRSVRLFLQAELLAGTVYTVTVDSGVADCLGNSTLLEQLVEVGLAEPPAAGDLVINEILFNPYSGGTDFIELFNRSDKIINVQGLRLANEAITSGTLAAQISNNYLLFPGEYVVFTADPDELAPFYTIPNPAALLENAIPSMGDKEGNLSLYSPDFVLLDAVDYSESWHSALLSDRNGVSLERLRADGVTQSPGNWSSAAEVVGYATPTGKNSQARDEVAAPDDDNLFTLPNRTFSPDQDGFEDLLEIQYTTDQAGYVANIVIFDGQGRQVRRLRKAELLAGQGSLIWDGTRDDGSRARIGIYIILVEYFTPEGVTRQEKLTCVLAGQLD